MMKDAIVYTLVMVNFPILVYISLLWVGGYDMHTLKREKPAKKALSSNKYMLKYIQKMIRKVYYQSKLSHKWNTYSLIDIEHDIEILCCTLFKQSDDWNWQKYQIQCINTIDNVKTVIRNYYQEGRYKQAAECMITYLSLCEVNILSHNVKDKSVLDDADNELYYLFMHFLYIVQYREKDEISFTPQEMVDILRQQNTGISQTEEWYQELQDDLELFRKYYKTSLFRMNGMILIPEHIINK